MTRPEEIEAITGHPCSSAVLEILDSAARALKMLPGAQDDALHAEEPKDRATARAQVLAIGAAVARAESQAFALAEREAKAARSRKAQPPGMGKFSR